MKEIPIKITASTSFISCCFTLAFTSADIFHQLLEFYLTLSEKQFLSRISLFLTDPVNATPTCLRTKIR